MVSVCIIVDQIASQSKISLLAGNFQAQNAEASSWRAAEADQKWGRGVVPAARPIGKSCVMSVFLAGGVWSLLPLPLSLHSHRAGRAQWPSFSWGTRKPFWHFNRLQVLSGRAEMLTAL